jgi:hypothetical protein
MQDQRGSEIGGSDICRSKKWGLVSHIKIYGRGRRETIEFSDKRGARNSAGGGSSLE